MGALSDLCHGAPSILRTLVLANICVLFVCILFCVGRYLLTSFSIVSENVTECFTMLDAMSRDLPAQGRGITRTIVSLLQLSVTIPGPQPAYYKLVSSAKSTDVVNILAPFWIHHCYQIGPGLRSSLLPK